MLVLLETCSGSAVELHLGQRSERFHPVWALCKNGHLKKFWLLAPVHYKYVKLPCHADMLLGSWATFFFLPELGKEDEENACCFGQGRFEKAEQ